MATAPSQKVSEEQKRAFAENGNPKLDQGVRVESKLASAIPAEMVYELAQEESQKQEKEDASEESKKHGPQQDANNQENSIVPEGVDENPKTLQRECEVTDPKYPRNALSQPCSKTFNIPVL